MAWTLSHPKTTEMAHTPSIQELDGTILSENTTWNCTKQFDFQEGSQYGVSFGENFNAPIMTAGSEQPPADEDNDSQGH